jgi:hypothetical protein
VESTLSAAVVFMGMSLVSKTPGNPIKKAIEEPTKKFEYRSTAMTPLA